MLIMSDPEGFDCPICNYSCRRNSNLLKHLSSNKHFLRSQSNVVEPEGKFQCKQCNKRYKGLSGL